MFPILINFCANYNRHTCFLKVINNLITIMSCYFLQFKWALSQSSRKHCKDPYFHCLRGLYISIYRDFFFFFNLLLVSKLQYQEFGPWVNLVILQGVSECAQIPRYWLFKNTHPQKHELFSIKQSINMRVSEEKVVLKVYSFCALFRDD